MRAFIDTNVFVYASYPDFPQFSKARDFLKSCFEGHDFWYLSWGVIYEYLSVVTHAKLFSGTVLSLSMAIENVMKFSSSSRVEILQETPEHARYLKGLGHELPGVVGSVLHDLHHVVLMKEHDLKKLYTADTDFHRFKEIEVVNPFL